ncbi:hypothetical protein TSOC_010039 [Tetrabaena socialis]|uniref:Uncharacterized protein n=1 Tax=Tetrabaena socialis TaxID=47790 RepID=A0A2J7ZUE4_9CHLO|nr:hypothetical protein TSOC_010039 [Tetrabaena socialis]|eukprot:PNH03868.1 hypothetical protein TSOC_010039 [Tetrabaena socialis]
MTPVALSTQRLWPRLDQLAEEVDGLLAAKALCGRLEVLRDNGTVDPRLHQDTKGCRPCQLAAERGCLDLAEMLLPSTPLAAIFSGDDAPRLYKVPKLKALASAALQEALLAQITRLEVGTEARRRVATEAAVAAARAGSGTLGGGGGGAAAGDGGGGGVPYDADGGGGGGGGLSHAPSLMGAVSSAFDRARRQSLRSVRSIHQRLRRTLTLTRDSKSTELRGYPNYIGGAAAAMETMPYGGADGYGNYTHAVPELAGAGSGAVASSNQHHFLAAAAGTTSAYGIVASASTSAYGSLSPAPYNGPGSAAAPRPAAAAASPARGRWKAGGQGGASAADFAAIGGSPQPMYDAAPPLGSRSLVYGTLGSGRPLGTASGGGGGQRTPPLPGGTSPLFGGSPERGPSLDTPPGGAYAHAVAPPWLTAPSRGGGGGGVAGPLASAPPFWGLGGASPPAGHSPVSGPAFEASAAGAAAYTTSPPPPPPPPWLTAPPPVRGGSPPPTGGPANAPGVGMDRLPAAAPPLLPSPFALLAMQGATPWSRDRAHCTALHYAALHDQHRVIDVLLDHPASARPPPRMRQTFVRLVDLPNFCGYTPAHYAAAAGKTKALSALMAGGANIAARSWAEGHDWISGCVRAECSREVTRMMETQPPSCPYCRGLVHGFG